MLKKIFAVPLSELKRVFKTEDTRFILMVGIKVSGISIIISGFLYWFLYQILRVNHAFFRANGFPAFDDVPFLDFVAQEAIENLSILFMFHIFLFFIGTYVGWLILRPFKTMGDYCEKVIESPDLIYKIDEFSTYSLFARFSEFFFEFLRDSRKKQGLLPNSIPPQYSKIHKPVFDKVFMLHFGLLLVIISISSAVFIIENSSTVYESMIELATKTLKNHHVVTKFFAQQIFILDEIVYLTVGLLTLGYLMLGLHLYSKVSGAAFGIFSTMRSYMKGNHSSRVHLVGYSHVRDNTRKLNKYLDYMQNKFSGPSKN